MAGDDQLHRPPYARGERPWFLPYNRKLRHLQGITIRNVTITQDTFKRERGKTIDDDAIPQSLRSPAKLLAQKEKKELTHARSSSDLRSIGEASIVNSGPGEKSSVDTGRTSPTRARLKPLRRRSSMAWTEASPTARQERLQENARSRMLDSFFALHIEGQDGPIYVSETAEQAMQPTFRFFDIESCGPSVTRLEDIIVKLFAKTHDTQDYRFVLELRVNLPSLQYIGKSIESFGLPLAENAVIFHLEDGIYTSLAHLPNAASLSTTLAGAPRASAHRVLSTSSYDALMRLSTLDTCIQDALHTRDKLAAQISDILTTHRASFAKVESVPEGRESAARVFPAANLQRKRLENAVRKRDELRESIEHRRRSFQQGRDAQIRAERAMQDGRAPLNDLRTQGHRTVDEITGQRRRCCEDLQSIYPIEPVPGRSLSFSIRGLPLPNSNFEECDESTTAAALGFVAHTVHLLSFYLSSPLPYPITPHGSTSTVYDPISQTPSGSQSSGPPTYPLFMKGAVRYRFEYAVFLLNKNIETLACHLGLRVMDIRQTLPNLKYLLYIATSGKGDLPARKAGGIRALLLKRGEGSGVTTPTLSRFGSDDGSEAGSDRSGVHASTAAEALKTKLPEGRPVTVANGGLLRGKSPATAHLSRLRDVSS